MKDQSKTKQTLIQKRTSLNEASVYAESIVNTVRESLIILNQDLRVVFANRSFYEFFKVKPEETMGQLIYDLGNKQWDIPKLRELLEDILIQKARFDNYEVEHDFPSIGRRTMLLNARRIQRMLGKGRLLLLAIEDITERKQAKKKLWESEASYRQLFDNSPAAIYRIDFKSGKFLKANDVCCKYLGCSQGEITSLSPYDILTEESRKLFLERLGKMTLGVKVPKKVEYEVVDKKGKRWCLQLHTKNIYDAEGHVVASDVVAHDITERKQMESSLQKSEENFRHSLDDSPLGVRISTIEGETLYANRVILDIYGYDSIEELKQTPLKERYTPESYAEFQLRKEKRLRGEFGPSEYEISIVRKDGETSHLHVFRKEIFWNGKKQSQVIYQDITERRQAEEKLNDTLESLRRSFGTTIQVLVSALESRDPYTAGHQFRVTHLARAIAMEMGLAQEKIEGIRMAGSIHDIGKLSIPAEILSKPTKLTKNEFALIKEHPQSGYEILKNVKSPWPLAQIVYQHHERMDGSGYPRNLKGDEIFIEARIMAVADVVEAMASHRPYRPGLGIEAALEEIEKNKGILYDNTVVDTCLKLFREKGYQLK